MTFASVTPIMGTSLCCCHLAPAAWVWFIRALKFLLKALQQKVNGFILDIVKQIK